MEEQVPLVVSHTFRVVSEEADITGEGEEHIERVEEGERKEKGRDGWRKRGKRGRESEMTVLSKSKRTTRTY